MWRGGCVVCAERGVMYGGEDLCVMCAGEGVC